MGIKKPQTGLGLMSLSPYYMEIMGVCIDLGTHDGISHDKISWKEICVGYDWIFGLSFWLSSQKNVVCPRKFWIDSFWYHEKPGVGEDAEF